MDVGQQMRAVSKGLAYKRPTDVSNAHPLPPIDFLRDRYHVLNGVLMHTRLCRAIKGRQVKIDGKHYITNRVVYAIEHGRDPGDLMIRDGKASQYRKAEGSVKVRKRLRVGDRFAAQVSADGKTVTVGVYKTREDAELACTLFIEAMEHNHV